MDKAEAIAKSLQAAFLSASKKSEMGGYVGDITTDEPWTVDGSFNIKIVVRELIGQLHEEGLMIIDRSMQS